MHSLVRPLTTAFLLSAPGLALAQALAPGQDQQFQPSSAGQAGDSQWTEQAPPPPFPPGQGQQYGQQGQAPGFEGDPNQAPGSDRLQYGPPAQPPSQDDFEQALDPYGQWVDDEELGRVWQPSQEAVGEDFTPYVTNGSWGYSDAGWGWNSGYAWGWAPFHYGRWYNSPARGWCWWPQNQWGPAWVNWRWANGYAAWSALPPPGYNLGFALGVPGWSFAPYRYFGRPYLSRYVMYPRPGFGAGAWGYRGGWSWSRQPYWHSAGAVGRGYAGGGYGGGRSWYGGHFAGARGGAGGGAGYYHGASPAYRGGGVSNGFRPGVGSLGFPGAGGWLPGRRQHRRRVSRARQRPQRHQRRIRQRFSRIRWLQRGRWQSGWWIPWLQRRERRRRLPRRWRGRWRRPFRRRRSWRRWGRPSLAVCYALEGGRTSFRLRAIIIG